jgi:uncharacterized membrane protein YtjA (UPF0391 family)
LAGTRLNAGALGKRHCIWLEADMLKWALIFLVIALIAGALGFTGVAGAAMGIAKFLFFIFLVLFVLFIALGVTVFKKVT